eukprot:jgi/Botrbrau1/13879/Bobra.0056s0111.1
MGQDRDRRWNRSRSRERDRERERDRDRDRRRDRSPYRRRSDRSERDRSDRDRDSRRRRSSSRDRRDYRHRSRSHSRPRSRSREHDRARTRDNRDLKGAYASRFASGGRVFEGNGGLPALDETRPHDFSGEYQAAPAYDVHSHQAVAVAPTQDGTAQQYEHAAYGTTGQQPYTAYDAQSYDAQSYTYYQGYYNQEQQPADQLAYPDARGSAEYANAYKQEAYAAYGASLEAGLDGNIDPQGGHHEQAQLADTERQKGEGYVAFGSMDGSSYEQFASDQVGGESEHDGWRSRGNDYNYDDAAYSDGLEYDERNNDWREPDRGRERHNSRDRDYDRRGERDRDRDWDRDRYRDRRRETSPSPTLYMRGLPENCSEADVRSVLEVFSGILDIRISRDRHTGEARFGFVDCESVETATRVMDVSRDRGLSIHGELIRFEYSVAPQPGNFAASGSSMDWICPQCDATNFSRRFACFQCTSVRPSNVKRVNIDEKPSHVLKIGGLDPQTEEDTLRAVFAEIAPLKAVRLIRESRSSSRRSFGFVEFYSIEDATKALKALQNTSLPGQRATLRLAYARGRGNDAGPKPTNTPALEAIQAAHAMSGAYNTWQPKDFNEAETEASADPYAAWAPKEFDSAALEGPTSTSGGNLALAAVVLSNGQSEPAHSQAPAAAEVSVLREAEGEAPAPATSGAQAQSGFAYDSASGYYYDPGSGYYYDANTNLYYSSQAQSWMMLDSTTGQYVTYTGAEGTTGAAPAVVSAAQAALSAATSVVSTAKALATLTAPEVNYEPPNDPAARKKGAVIGAPAVLNPEGLLHAAHVAQEKELLRKQQEAAAVRKQRAAEAKAAAAARAAAAKAAAANARAEAEGAAPAAQPSVVVPGAVRGVIRSSGKWGGPK